MSKEVKISVKDRLPFLDIFRFYIVLMVLLFHAVIHGFWSLSKQTFLYKNIITGAVYMDAFYILSGFILYYLYGEKIKKINYSDIKSFYIKRFLKIYPEYIVYTLIIMIYKDDFELGVLPIQLLCLQGFFSEVFTRFGNGGTWFISCIMLFYLCFPVISCYVRECKFDMRYIIFLYFLIVYISVFSVLYSVSERAIYINPLYRLLEFTIGMYLSKIFLKSSAYKNFGLYAICFIVIFCISISVLYKNRFINHVNFMNHYIYYTVISIPLLSAVIYFCAGIKNRWTRFLAQSRILVFLSDFTFPFFLWQGLAQSLAKKFFPSLNGFIIFNFILAIVAYGVLNKKHGKFQSFIINCVRK